MKGVAFYKQFSPPRQNVQNFLDVPFLNFPRDLKKKLF